MNDIDQLGAIALRCMGEQIHRLVTIGACSHAPLYLAISQDIYQEFFIKSFIQDSLAEYSIKLLIIDLVSQDIVLWKE